MLVQGRQKKILQDVIVYFVTTTGLNYEEFFRRARELPSELENVDDATWLAVQAIGMLQHHGVTLSDCIENKDVVRAAVEAGDSREGGEFFTPEVWAQDGRAYLKEMLGDQWGKAVIWDASCGSGNLLRTANYPADKLFLSTILEEDVSLLEHQFPGSTVFQCDFVNDLDIDQYNRWFSNKLPEKLQEVLRSNTPLVFFMNPPYKVLGPGNSDLSTDMANRGMAKAALDLFNQFMYRICLLKREYALTDVYLGIYGPITLYHSKVLEPLYTEFKKDFVFYDGMCFDAMEFSSTSESIGWVVGFAAWRTRREGDEDRVVRLTAKRSKPDGTWVATGERVVTNVEENLHYWCYPKDVVRYEYQQMISQFARTKPSLVKVPPDAVGHLMSSTFVIRATRRAAITSLPNTDNIPITKENFWRCMASFGARRVYGAEANPFNNCQYYSRPDDQKSGYEQWVTDILPMFLFDTQSQQTSYRDFDADGVSWTSANRLFPLSAERVRDLTTDERVLADLEQYPSENEWFLAELERCVPLFSEPARALYDYGMGCLEYSLQGTRRKDAEYAYWTQAWDAGFMQLRYAPGVFTEKMMKEQLRLLGQLKTALVPGVYEYGFLMNADYPLEGENVVVLDEVESEYLTDLDLK